ncbi:bifunctional 5,10-methylenetetrahydrofolate dehydrogenase/5,10-methenyltetrahydrofolate cyclohydrolase [Candidatus Uhrbacteria bacterium]|nr:bifunctional 5,10-methylenetetrahydrofolate dehydrogenase/5,10-methenyltetrahydrofolate cyclohydrolase [Candidatus Uhrbacteria bacterium]
MAEILDGRAIAERIRSKIKVRIASLSSEPGLAVLLVGDDPASHTYVSIKQHACEEVGIRFEKYLYQADTITDELTKKIDELNARPDIHGILVQLPLPNQDTNQVIARIDPNKDVDGFHPENLQRLKAGKPAIASAVALGVIKLIGQATIKATGTAKIISSPLFAEPLSVLLAEQQMSSTVVDPNDPNLSEKTKTADILIVAVGRPGLITGAMIKPGAIVIDVGTSKVNGKLYGDVDRASVEPVAGALTPVPGGVGPMTVAMLLSNVLKALSLQRHDLVDHSSDK